MLFFTRAITKGLTFIYLSIPVAQKLGNCFEIPAYLSHSNASSACHRALAELTVPCRMFWWGSGISGRTCLTMKVELWENGKWRKWRQWSVFWWRIVQRFSGWFWSCTIDIGGKRRTEQANAYNCGENNSEDSGEELDDDNLPLFYNRPRFKWTGGEYITPAPDTRTEYTRQPDSMCVLDVRVVDVT